MARSLVAYPQLRQAGTTATCPHMRTTQSPHQHPRTGVSQGNRLPAGAGQGAAKLGSSWKSAVQGTAQLWQCHRRWQSLLGLGPSPHRPPHGQHHTKTLGDLPGWCLARVPSWDWRHLETCGQQQPQLEMLMLPPQWQKVENHHWERKGKGGAGKGLLQ